MAFRPLLLALLVVAPAGLLSATALDLAPQGDDPLAAYPPGSTLLPDGGVAIPLRLDTPASYTPEIHQKVLAASTKGMGYEPETDREVPLATGFLFIRPGAWMWSPSWCTLNFVYGTPNNYKIGSAGHCNALNSQVVIVAYPGVFVNIGKTTASRNFGPGDDWSIITIHPQFQGSVDANVADVWGPQGGAYTGTFLATQGFPTKHTGHGTGIGTGGTPRAGYAIAVVGSTVYYVGAITFGDSGGPLLMPTPQHPLGQALAVITHLAVGVPYTGLGTRVASIPEVVRDGDLNPLPPA